MLQNSSLVYLVVLSLLIVFTLLRNFFSSDKSLIWSPLTFISLTLIYYVVLPSIDGLSRHNAANVEHQSLFYIAAVVFYSCVLLGYSINSKTQFPKWNSLLNADNSLILGITLFAFALACYVPFRGFRTTIWSEDAYLVTERQGFVSYFIDLISVFCASAALLLMKYRSHRSKFKYMLPFLMVLYLAVVFYVVGGFRVRLVYLIIALITAYHLYPKPRRFNFPLVSVIAIVTYLGFAVMDVSREYGYGIDRDAVAYVDLDQAKEGAGENVDVCCFSIAAMDNYYRHGDFEFFEPIITAVFMPIPRAVFPWKPDGEYIRRVQLRTIGSYEGGAAFLNFAEGYVSFGWLGVILYGLLMGAISRKFWSNYYLNKSSIGAILLLAMYNGFCYQWISRGYLGGNFNSFLYYVIVPFWLMSLFTKVAHLFKR